MSRQARALAAAGVLLGIAMAVACPLAGATRALRPAADAAVYRLQLAPETRDHFLASPPARGVRNIWLALDARRASPKTRVMFQGAIAPGRLRLHVEVTGGSADSSYVVALPLAAGHSQVVVSISGLGRFDLGFFADGPQLPPKEYRFTRQAPLDPTPFDIQIPATPR